MIFVIPNCLFVMSDNLDYLVLQRCGGVLCLHDASPYPFHNTDNRRVRVFVYLVKHIVLGVTELRREHTCPFPIFVQEQREFPELAVSDGLCLCKQKFLRFHQPCILRFLVYVNVKPIVQAITCPSTGTPRSPSSRLRSWVFAPFLSRLSLRTEVARVFPERFSDVC